MSVKNEENRMKRIFLIVLITVSGVLGATAQNLAINTEVTSDACMAPNLGVELITGDRSSVSLNALYGKGMIGKQIDIKAIQPEYRYYFSGRPVYKWFVGVGAIGLLFDVKVKGKVYDGYGGGLGMTFGYVWNLTQRLSLDFHTGLGAIFYNRKEYFLNDNYDVDYTLDGAERANAHGYYLLPTRIGISVSYLLK